MIEIGTIRKVSEITKELPKYLLPLSNQDFLNLRLNKKPFNRHNTIEQELHALDIVTIVHYSVGDKGENPDLLEFQKNELLHCLKGENGQLTVDEIKKSLDMLIQNDFGQYFGLNRKSYYQALKGFRELPKRAESMNQFVKLLEPKPVELTPEEKLKKNKEACVWCFNFYKNTKQIPNGHYKFYQTLLDSGLIKWTQEEKKAISGPVKAEYEKDLETSKKRGHISTSQLAELLITLDSNPTLISRVRKVALAKYFDSLINSGVDLETIIK